MDEHAYFRAIEEHFIDLRGAPLLLSPADYQTARRWWRDEIPLDVVRSALDEVFARRAERAAERPVQSLRYCASAVEAAWRRASEMQRSDVRRAAAPIEVAGRLEALAGAVPEAHPGAAALRRRILALEGAPESVESELATLDEQMLADAEESLDPDEREALEQRLGRSLAALAERLPSDEVERARRRLFERALRHERHLPVLSLFADG